MGRFSEVLRSLNTLKPQGALGRKRYPPLEPPIAQLQMPPAGTRGRENDRLILQLTNA